MKNYNVAIILYFLVICYSCTTNRYDTSYPLKDKIRFDRKDSTFYKCLSFYKDKRITSEDKLFDISLFISTKSLQIRNQEDSLLEIPINICISRSTYCKGIMGYRFNIENAVGLDGSINTSGILKLIIASDKSKILKSKNVDKIKYEEKYTSKKELVRRTALHLGEGMEVTGCMKTLLFRYRVNYTSDNRIESMELEPLGIEVYEEKNMPKPYLITNLSRLSDIEKNVDIYMMY